jgi:hypothetical protein
MPTELPARRPWVQLNPTGALPGRVNHLLGYDPNSNRLIVTMGGRSGPCFTPGTCGTDPVDAWILTNANGLGGTPTWTQLATTGNPPGRLTVQMDQSMYDPVSNSFLVFGGFDQVQSLNDVWVLSNANGLGGAAAWTQISPSGALPPARYGAAGFYDAGTNRLGIFGGQDEFTGVIYNDFWLLNNANGVGGAPVWNQISPGGTPISKRFGSSGVYDSVHNRMVVFGGDVAGFVANETWVLSNANGTVGSTLAVQYISPSHGGNAGSVTMQIVGSGFQSGATVTLTGVGAGIIGANTSVPNPSVLTTTFDLTGATPGVRDVVVTNPDGTSITLNGGFNVEQGGTPQLSVNIIGRNKIRIGRDQAYYVAIENSGNVDAAGSFLWVQFPIQAQLGLGFPLVPVSAFSVSAPFSNSASTVSDSSIPFEVSVGNSTLAGFLIPFVPAGGNVTLPISLAVTSAIAPFQLQSWLSPTFLATASGNAVLNDPIHATLCTADILSFLAGLGGAPSIYTLAINTELHVMLTGAPSTSPAAVRSILQWANSVVQAVNGPPGSGFYTPQVALQMSGQLARGLSLYTLYNDCSSVANSFMQTYQDLSLSPVNSLDPNEKVGPQGVGQNEYISGQQRIPYAIYFDNQPTATAPAQAVTVSDTLDPNVNPSTLTLGAITFPNQVVSPPSIPLSVSPFTTTVDLRPATNLLVKINASLNTSTGVLTWALQSLDPATGQPPTDPLAGFLPPGAEGSVFFTVMPKSTATTATVIQNTATIVFDLNPPINTPTWSNTIDATPPTSKVALMPSAETSYRFLVQWSGSDIGSGIQDYTIYVSDNGGPFTAWLTNATTTQGNYSGVGGHSYGFYSIARDLVGNIEGGKNIAEATTRVIVDTTPPVIIPQITGTLGTNGWYRSNVTVSWSVADPESGIGSSSGCITTNLTVETAGITLTCSATNGAGLSSSVPVTIKIDKTPPVISGLPAPGCSLWPPNGKMVQVATVTGADALSGLAPGSFQITGTSNEPPSAPEISITPNGTGGYIVQLLADRLGTGSGRVYTLTATATDLAGNPATATATCTVPHDQGK